MTNIIAGMAITVIIGFMVGVCFTRTLDKQFLTYGKNSKCKNTSDAEEEANLKDRVLNLEKHYHGLNALEALEKEGIKEGSIIEKACFSSMPGIPCYEYRIFVVTECSHEMLEDDEIMVEDIHHHSEKIDVFCTRLASEKDREEFIHAYNDYADKSKIEIPNEDLHVVKHPDSK